MRVGLADAFYIDTRVNESKHASAYVYARVIHRTRTSALNAFNADSKMLNDSYLLRPPTLHDDIANDHNKTM